MVGLTKLVVEVVVEWIELIVEVVTELIELIVEDVLELTELIDAELVVGVTELVVLDDVCCLPESRDDLTVLIDLEAEVTDCGRDRSLDLTVLLEVEDRLEARDASLVGRGRAR